MHRRQNRRGGGGVKGALASPNKKSFLCKVIHKHAHIFFGLTRFLIRSSRSPPHFQFASDVTKMFILILLFAFMHCKSELYIKIFVNLEIVIFLIKLSLKFFFKNTTITQDDNVEFLIHINDGKEKIEFCLFL